VFDGLVRHNIKMTSADKLKLKVALSSEEYEYLLQRSIQELFVIVNTFPIYIDSTKIKMLKKTLISDETKNAYLNRRTQQEQQKVL